MPASDSATGTSSGESNWKALPRPADTVPPARHHGNQRVRRSTFVVLTFTGACPAYCILYTVYCLLGQAKKDAIQSEIKATDQDIDLLVHELYGLTEEEIRIVEGTP
jgi:hypothetical protein